MTDIGKITIYTIIETCFFYCWIQLPTVVVRLVFWLAISPIGGQVVAATWSSSCALETQPLHEVPREAVSDSKLYPLCCLQSSRLGIFPRLWPHFFFLPTPLLSNISLLNRIEMSPWMTQSRTIAFWSRCPSDLQFGWHFPLHFEDTLPIRFKFLNGGVLMNHGIGPGCARLSMHSANKPTENIRRESRTIVQFCSCYDCCRPRC